jgi:hypothetical protein
MLEAKEPTYIHTEEHALIRYGVSVQNQQPSSIVCKDFREQCKQKIHKKIMYILAEM